MAVSATVSPYVVTPVVPFTTLETISLPVTGAAGTVPVSLGIGGTTAFQAVPAAADAVVTDPANAAKNTIQATADVAELTLKMFAGQTNAPFVVEDSANTIIGGMSALGSMIARGEQLGITPKSANYTATGGDYFIPVDATAGAVTITLPSIPGAGTFSNQFVVAKIDASTNTVVIAAAGGQTINGAATLSLGSQYQTVVLEARTGAGDWLAFPDSAALNSAVILAPNTVNRNLIQPTVDFIHGLAIRSHSVTQNASLLEIQRTGGQAVTGFGDIEAGQFALSIQGKDGLDAKYLIINTGNTTAGTRALAQFSSFDDGGNYKGEFYVDNDCSLILWHPTTGGSDEISGRIQHGMLDDTDGTFKGRLILLANDFNAPSVGRAFLIGEADGAAARIGFLGATAVARQVGASAAGIAAIVDPNAQAAIQALQTALANFGLITSPA